LVCLKAEKSIFDIFSICVESMSSRVNGVNREYETCQIFLNFKTFVMTFGHLEQKLELSIQSMCKKFLKNNAHIKVYISNDWHYFHWNFPEKKTSE
jgi:hypothetical protein